MINYETILSLFDDKLTLLEYLTKIQKALENEQLTSINVTQTDTTHVYFTFVFGDGSTIDTPTFTLPQGAKGDKGDKGDTGEAGADGADGTSVVSAYINSSSNLILTLSNGHILNCGKIYNGLIKLNVSLSGDIDESSGLTGTLLDSEYEAVIDDTINLVGFTMNYINYWLVKTYTSTIGGVALLTSIDILEGADKIIYAEVSKEDDTPTITIKRRKIEGVAIGSKNATSGKVLTADGDGGASWETALSSVTASDVDSGSEASGKALMTDGNGGASWEQIVAGKISSGSATNGEVLTADGNGGASWTSASGGTTLHKYTFTTSNTPTTAQLKTIYNILNNAISVVSFLNDTTSYPILYSNYSTLKLLYGIYIYTNTLKFFKYTLNSSGAVANGVLFSYDFNNNTFNESTPSSIGKMTIVYWNETEIS